MIRLTPSEAYIFLASKGLISPGKAVPDTVFTDLKALQESGWSWKIKWKWEYDNQFNQWVNIPRWVSTIELDQARTYSSI